MAEHARASEHGMSLNAKAARNLATATVTVPRDGSAPPGGCTNFCPG